MIPAEARGAWRDIEARLRPFVARRVTSAAEVDDVVQEILVRVHKGVASLRDGESFGGWVYRIAARAIADAARAEARQPLARAADSVDAASEDPDEPAELQRELGECVALFVARLPSPYREAITLTELQGLTQKDAADMLGTSLSGMKSRVQRGRDKIRAMFEECCEISVDCRGRVVECAARDLAQVPEDCRDAAASWAARRPAGSHGRSSR
ncbi:MAG TPA: sigma-70 family RNA polymerase sigma factor [Polyangia bacterium]|nr:sigma-70 family RNA polymerase sigma factor [Polyangia bacterium]